VNTLYELVDPHSHGLASQSMHGKGISKLKAEFLFFDYPAGNINTEHLVRMLQYYAPICDYTESEEEYQACMIQCLKENLNYDVLPNETQNHYDARLKLFMHFMNLLWDEPDEEIRGESQETHSMRAPHTLMPGEFIPNTMYIALPIHSRSDRQPVNFPVEETPVLQDMPSLRPNPFQ
jgi:hypothetical protein